MSEFTTTVPSTDNVNIVSTSDIPELIITNKVNRVLDYTDRNGKKVYTDEVDADDNKLYGDAFTVVTTDLDYKHPATISMNAVSAIKADKEQQEKPFRYADGSVEGTDKALCYGLRGEVNEFPAREVVDPITAQKTKEPKKLCGNYYPFYGYTPVPATNVDLTQ